MFLVCRAGLGRFFILRVVRIGYPNIDRDEGKRGVFDDDVLMTPL